MKRFIPFLLLFLLCSSANASFKKLRVLIYKEPGYSGGWQTHEISPQEPPPPMHCPEGSLYNMSAGRCEMYKFLTVFAVSTFDDGRAFCRNLGGILAEIDNSTENTQAKDVASKLGYSVWIGGTDQGSEGTWRWVESGRVFYIKGQSSQPGYSNWASSSYPRTNTSYNCAYMNTGGYWYDDSCTTNYRPLCELYVSDALCPEGFTYTTVKGQRGVVGLCYMSKEAPPDAPPPGTVCPEGTAWIRDIGRCGYLKYELVTTSRTWSSARADCQTRGYDLAVIHSQAEDSVLLALSMYGASQQTYVGGTDVEKEGTWKWFTGEVYWIGGPSGKCQPGMYCAWHPAMPDDWGSSEDFMTIGFNHSSYSTPSVFRHWNDAYASFTTSYICEYKPSEDRCPQGLTLMCQWRLGKCWCVK